MKISVIVPTRFQKNPVSTLGNLWLDRALCQVQRQSYTGEREIVLGVDAGQRPPERFSNVIVADSGTVGQAAAVNAAVKASTGDVLAFLEDDDYWEANKLEEQLPWLDKFDFVSCNQRLIDEDGNFVGYNAFATPSGWMMRRELWDRVGPMDTSVQWHVDTEWLGRLNASGAKRVHLLHQGVQTEPLRFIARKSLIVEGAHREPLVQRLVNPKGGMAKIATDPIAKGVSDYEHRFMMGAFSEIPW